MPSLKPATVRDFCWHAPGCPSPMHLPASCWASCSPTSGSRRTRFRSRALCQAVNSRKARLSTSEPPTRAPCWALAAVAADSPAALHSPSVQPGDVAVRPDHTLSVAVHQPAYEVALTYSARGRPLEGAARVWAHTGHSGWQDTQDVELARSPEDPEVWRGQYRVPAGRLVAAWQLKLQAAFKGLAGPQQVEQWDNNGGSNWQLEVELRPKKGLVAGSAAAPVPRALVAGLLLRCEALTASGLLSAEQGALLRTLAWQRDFRLLSLYEQVKAAEDAEVVAALVPQCDVLRRPGLHVVHIASEMAPIAKVGGLADVVPSLAKAHQATGTLAEVILPKYDCIDYRDVSDLRRLMEVTVAWGGDGVRTQIWSCVSDGLPVYFIEPYSSHKFFWRGRFYGENDDAERFLFFARAALEFLLRAGKQPDVLHVHDWQSAAVPPLLVEEFRARGLTRPGTVLTIHNIAFQGWLTPDYLGLMGLPRERLYTPDRMLDDSRPGFRPDQPDVNLLKGGVVYADRVTTVSPTYAREVFDPTFGMGLQGVLLRHADKFNGVLNGIDHETWDPATDPLLSAHFSAADTSGKAACKRALLQEVGLPWQPCWAPGTTGGNNGSNGNQDGGGPGRPLLAVVTRLTEQKGLPLILAGIRAATARGAQVVLLGSAPDPQVQAQFVAMAEEAGRGADARYVLRYDEGLSHRIYAGADMILIPSFFEPCGLTQLISLRYGTIPVVRSTGGLADTVTDVAHSDSPEHQRNGFTFTGKETYDVEVALGRAIEAYSAGQEWWARTLVPRAMAQDWSWSRSAQSYLDIYRSLPRR